MLVKMVGYKSFVGKKENKKFHIINTVIPYSLKELDYDNHGCKIEEKWLTAEQYAIVSKPELLGSEISLNYELDGSKPFLASVSVPVPTAK